MGHTAAKYLETAPAAKYLTLCTFLSTSGNLYDLSLAILSTLNFVCANFIISSLFFHSLKRCMSCMSTPDQHPASLVPAADGLMVPETWVGSLARPYAHFRPLRTCPNTLSYYGSPQKIYEDICYRLYSSRWSGSSMLASPHFLLEYHCPFPRALIHSKFRQVNSKARWQSYYRPRLVIACGR